MNRSLKAICPVIGAAFGLVLTLDPRTSLGLMASFGVSSTEQARLESALGGPVAIDLVKEAFESASPVVAQEGPEFVPGAAELASLGIGRTVFLPLQLEGSVLLGGVALGFAERAPFTESELRLLWACAEQMAIAYHVACERQALSQALEESQRLEASLRQTEARFRAIAENSQDVIVIKDVDSRYVFANRFCGQIVGRDPEALLGLTESDLMSPEFGALSRAEDLQVMTRGRPMVFERAVPIAGGERVFQSHKVPLYGPGGEIQGILLISRDATERIERERLQQAQIDQLQQLDRLKDNFLSAASHELRTPLSSIVGYAEFLEDELEGPLTPFQRDYIHNIQASAEQLQRLVSDMLDFALLEAGTFAFTFKVFDLLEIVRQAVNRMLPLAIKGGIVLEAELPGEPCSLSMDPDRVSQVIQNLLANAIKFTPREGRIAIRARRLEGKVEVRVVDTGIGIEPTHMSRIFQRFYQADTGTTRQRGGAGLGLSIAKALVEAHGGEIGAHSVPGEGSTFWFTLSTRLT